MKIVSGGQTGVDRAALDLALELGIPCGGWCPNGRLAEDGPIPDSYPLTETTYSDYRVRTRKNIEESDATLVLTVGRPTGGTALTVRLAQELRKPCLVVDLDQAADIARVVAWIEKNRVTILNVAGPRESKSSGVHGLALNFLRGVFTWTS
ncbi:molybdenum cofactor carrier [candidate division BRC1 bacterium HGW-BRC1-1]|jgi:hypothetical protein|nr:MAG: molybdenum cofactor carrier [candidate division BRC1 bacterium HGW-BRC1-1]